MRPGLSAVPGRRGLSSDPHGPPEMCTVGRGSTGPRARLKTSATCQMEVHKSLVCRYLGPGDFMIDDDIADQTWKKNQGENCSVQAFAEHINWYNTPSTYLRTLGQNASQQGVELVRLVREYRAIPLITNLRSAAWLLNAWQTSLGERPLPGNRGLDEGPSLV